MRKLAVDHAHPVVHVPGVPELAHAGVHEGDAGLPALPRLEVGRLIPLERVELGPVVLRGEVGVVEQDVPVELAPSKLAQELRDVRAGRGRDVAVHALPHLERADLAEAQVRAEPARHVARGLIAAVVVLQIVARRTRSRRSWAACSPGVQVSRRPSAQSGRVGSRCQSSSSSDVARS